MIRKFFDVVFDSSMFKFEFVEEYVFAWIITFLNLKFAAVEVN